MQHNFHNSVCIKAERHAETTHAYALLCNEKGFTNDKPQVSAISYSPFATSGMR